MKFHTLVTLCGVLILVFLGHVRPMSAAEGEGATDTLVNLSELLTLRQGLQQDISALNTSLKKAGSAAEKADLEKQLTKLNVDLDTVTENFEQIVAGNDLTALRTEEKTEFKFQQEILALLRPAIDEMKAMTAKVRKKADLREKIAQNMERLPKIEQALASVEGLIQQAKEPKVLKELKGIQAKWKKVLALMQSEMQSAQLQLDKMEAEETSLTETSQSYLKSFFQKRGLYLMEALLVVIGIGLLSQLSHKLLRRYMPGFNRIYRSFRVRLIELIHYVGTLVLMVMGPMLVFYLVEDWVLFSLGILLLIGIALTLRHALPRYILQIQTFLNIGAVREGERIQLDGLPWKVSKINVFCILTNPDANLSQRVHIDTLVGLKSRPRKQDEAWFPCKKDDWVVLSDGTRGKVTEISLEMVRLTERGGAHVTYQTADFLAASPRNLSTGFRLKEFIGISYSLQAESTAEIPNLLNAYVTQRLGEEGYGELLANLRVEFAMANNSSLDLAVVADFRGDAAEIYGRLQRALQRMCVEACTQYGWEIPFPQMTLHRSGASAKIDVD